MPVWSKGWQYFRSRVEGSFLRFFWSPDHKTWRVQDKSGVSMELGLPLNLQLLPNAHPNDGIHMGLRGAVLVRPDGHVAWRMPYVPADPARELAGVIDTLLH